MNYALSMYVVLLGAVITYRVYMQYARGEEELISARNFAVLGFLYFQIWSVLYPLMTGNMLHYRVDDMLTAGLIYVAMATVFVVIFGFIYKRGWIVSWLARKTPIPPSMPPEPVLWAVALALAPLAMLSKFAVSLPLVGLLTLYAGNSLAAMSAGIAAWIWARRMFNPAVALMAGALFLINSFTATIGEFGRRPLIGVAICMLWGMYFSVWRYQPLRRWLPTMAVLVTIPLIMLMVYSAVRMRHGASDTVDALMHGVQSSGDISKGFLSIFYSDTGAIGLWLIETHPDTFEPRPLFTLYYTFLNPVPRQWWPEKPYPLGMEITQMAGIRRVGENMNLGPGIIGHAAAEGGWYALVIYAILGALLLRYFDLLVKRAPRNPLIMLPLGSTLGQVVAMPRGETSLFTWIFVFGTGVTYMLMLMLAWMAKTAGVGAGAAPISEYAEDPHAHGEDHELEHEYAEYASEYEEHPEEAHESPADTRH